MSIRTTRQSPSAPDMLADGTPTVSYLRTSRARQVSSYPRPDERSTEPAYPRQHDGLLRRIIHGMLAHWLPLAFGVFLLIGLYTSYQQWVRPAWNTLQTQWHTGDGRIVQLDANVGHGGVSHFLAQYYEGRIVVIEIQASHPSHMHTYSVQAITPSTEQGQTITLSVEDVNHDGLLDLVIQEGNYNMAIVLYNTGNGFMTNRG